jgi:hypothetical protein
MLGGGAEITRLQRRSHNLIRRLAAVSTDVTGEGDGNLRSVRAPGGRPAGVPGRRDGEDPVRPSRKPGVVCTLRGEWNAFGGRNTEPPAILAQRAYPHLARSGPLEVPAHRPFAAARHSAPTARSDLTGILFLDQFGLYFSPDRRHCQGVRLAQWVVVSTRSDEFVALTRVLGRPR